MGKKIPKRICFFGGPGVGKTTIANALFVDLKKISVRVEYSPEHVKNWYFDDRDIDGWDQPYLLGQQIRYSHKPLKKGSDLVVEESPPELNAWYCNFFGVPVGKELIDAAWKYNEVYPTLPVFVQRVDSFYDNFGRFQDIEDAKSIDKGVKEMLDERLGEENYWSIDPRNYDEFLENVKKELRFKE